MSDPASAAINQRIQTLLNDAVGSPYDPDLMRDLNELARQCADVDAREAARQAASARATESVQITSFASAPRIDIPVDIASLSPESILALVEERLQSIDNAIRSSVSDVSARESDSRRLTEALELLNELGMTGSTDGDGDVADHESVSGRPVPEILRDLEERGVALPMTEHLIRRDVISHAIEGVNAELKQLNSTNEMTMIRLQDAIQSRTALLNLTTNVLNAMHEAEKNIIGNMRA